MSIFMGAVYKDAISNYGIQFDDNVNLELPFLSRPLMLSVRNSLRVRKRFVLNVFLLTIGGVLFITVLTTLISLNTTLSKNIDPLNYNYHFITPERDENKIADLLHDSDYITDYEIGNNGTVQLLDADENIEASYMLIAPEPNSRVISPDMLEGAWQNGKSGEVVISHEIACLYGYVVGDTALLKLGDTSHPFATSGIISDFSGSNIYIGKVDFISVSGEQDSLNDVKLVTKLSGRQKNMFKSIEAELYNINFSLLVSESKTELFDSFKSHYAVTLQTFFSRYFDDFAGVRIRSFRQYKYTN